MRIALALLLGLFCTASTMANTGKYDFFEVIDSVPSPEYVAMKQQIDCRNGMCEIVGPSATYGDIMATEPVVTYSEPVVTYGTPVVTYGEPVVTSVTYGEPVTMYQTSTMNVTTQTTCPRCGQIKVYNNGTLSRRQTRVANRQMRFQNWRKNRWRLFGGR